MANKLNETPRQKMIGILYLVLLGLVALSINSSVLDAFRTFKQSLNTSTQNVQKNVDNTISAFAASKLKDEPERARPAYEKAKLASKYANDLDAYITTVRTLMEEQGGGYDGTGDVRKRDNQDISYRLMITQKRGVELKNKINETRKNMMAIVGQQGSNNLNMALEAIDPPARGGIKTSWEETNFGAGIPLTAALTVLAKIRADLKNTEYEVIKKVLGEVDKAIMNLDNFAAVAVAPSSYVIQGQPYTAEVFLTASDSKSDAEIMVNGQPLETRGGKGLYSVNTNAEGLFSWSGTIKVKQTDGTVKEYQTGEQRYQVGKPSAVVSADKMNVFYAGISNPVSVSAPGIPKEKLRVSMSGGTISGANGHYSVNVSGTGTSRIIVAAEVAPGKMQTISSTEFRNKRIPDPKVKFAGKTGGRLSAVALKSQNKIFPVLENFDFDAKFSINRFTLIIVKPRADAVVLEGSGNTLSGSMQSAMQNIVPGSRVIFDNIIATGPDGMNRQLDPVSILAE